MAVRMEPRHGNQYMTSMRDNETMRREFANKSAASAASRDYVKFQAVIKSAASAASLAEAALAADWITAFFSQFLAALAAKK